MIKKILLFDGAITAAIALSLACLHLTNVAPSSFNPGEEFSITKVVDGESTCFLVLDNKGNVADSNLCGSTDLLCDPPYLILFDMNNDDHDDLYLHECGGHGYLSFDKSTRKLIYTDLGQYDESNIVAEPRFLFDLLKSGNTLLYAVLAGAVSLVSFLIFLFLKRKSENQGINMM